ncbi:MAG: isochorismatase family protein [Fusobacteriaceae bacterium]
MSKKVLLVIDVQIGVINLNIFDSNRILDNINILINKARASKTPIIFVRHFENSGELAKTHANFNIHPKLNYSSENLIIDKDTPNPFLGTKLNDELKKLGATSLVVCGLMTEYCIDTTCRVGRSHGYEIELVKDAHSTCDNKVLLASQIINHHNETLDGHFVKLKSTEEVVFD